MKFKLEQALVLMQALICLLYALWTLGCASRVLEYDPSKADQALKTDEFDKKIEVKDVVATAVGEAPASSPPESSPAKNKLAKKQQKKKKAKKEKSETKPETSIKPNSGAHLPDIEDGQGFIARRPINDPFRIGEKLVLNLSYFNIVAGTLELDVLPMVEVNGEKAYHFEVLAKSNSFFNHIYGVDDKALTYMSYQEMRPLSLQITLKESKQLVEARTFFDWKTLKASYWQKRVTKESGEESKKLEWDIKEYSQNVISAAYYLRTFKFEVGKKFALRVADEGRNIVFSGEVLRKEKLKTDIGVLDTIVMRPTLTVNGTFAQVGEILAWMTDDDRKFLVRLESKIKIGTIVAKVKSIDKGSAMP